MKCKNCGNYIEEISEKVYCSNACRQTAYRDRKRKSRKETAQKLVSLVRRSVTRYRQRDSDDDLESRCLLSLQERRKKHDKEIGINVSIADIDPPPKNFVTDWHNKMAEISPHGKPRKYKENE